MIRPGKLRTPVRRGLRSLRVQLWLWIALPAAIGLLALSLLELYAHERAMHQLVSARVQDQAQAVAALLDAQLVRLQEELVNLAQRSQVDRPQVERELPPSDLFSGGVALFDRHGQLIAARAAPWAADPDLSALLLHTRTDSNPVSIHVVSIHVDARGEWPIGASSPLLFGAATGADGSVLVGALPARALVETGVERVIQLDPAARLTILAGAETIAQIGSEDESPPEQAVEAQATVQATGWRIVLQQPVAEMLSPLLRIGVTIGFVAFIAAVISGLAAYFGLRYLVRPLRRLNAAAIKAGWGDTMPLHQPVEGVAEIEELRLALIRMTELVRRYQAQLRSYIDAMTLGQEEERKRLARELHDETVQALIALNQQMELAERELAHTPALAAERLRRLRPLVAQTIDGLRRQVQALRPLYLEDLGFVPALETLVHQMTQPAGIVGDFEVVGEPHEAVSPTLEMAVFRIVQEALHNAVTHARPSWVHVELCFEQDGLTVRIEDDGVGFEVPPHPFLLAQQGHFGLLGMHERTQAHGGRLSVESEPGKGTTVDARLPYPLDDHPAGEQAAAGM
ncbi:MAG TPA: sensor histidine kinase [Caldilineaceae bacterium]|nr:sensor histidine kinase [Caldilineaceae bacterium]